MVWRENADFIAEIRYLYASIDVELDGVGSRTVTTRRVAVGVRGLMADNFEGWVKVGYSRRRRLTMASFGGTIGGQFMFNPTWGLVGEVEFGDDTFSASYLVGVRASF